MTNYLLPLVLGSGSKSRISLLTNAGLVVDKIIVADINEDCLPKEKPRHYALRVARDKLDAIAKLTDDAFVITADTTTVCRGQILHKTDDDNLIRKYWQMTSGKRHKVYTGVCCAQIINNEIVQIKSKVVASIVQFGPITDAEIEHFVASGEGRGKSGACTLGGISSRYVKFISGSFSNVVGLPIYDTALLLKAIGYNMLKTREDITNGGSLTV